MSTPLSAMRVLLTTFGFLSFPACDQGMRMGGSKLSTRKRLSRNVWISHCPQNDGSSRGKAPPLSEGATEGFLTGIRPMEDILHRPDPMGDIGRLNFDFGHMA